MKNAKRESTGKKDASRNCKKRVAKYEICILNCCALYYERGNWIICHFVNDTNGDCVKIYNSKHNALKVAKKRFPITCDKLYYREIFNFISRLKKSFQRQNFSFDIFFKLISFYLSIRPHAENKWIQRNIQSWSTTRWSCKALVRAIHFFCLV